MEKSEETLIEEDKLLCLEGYIEQLRKLIKNCCFTLDRNKIVIFSEK